MYTIYVTLKEFTDWVEAQDPQKPLCLLDNNICPMADFAKFKTKHENVMADAGYSDVYLYDRSSKAIARVDFPAGFFVRYLHKVKNGTYGDLLANLRETNKL